MSPEKATNQPKKRNRRRRSRGKRAKTENDLAPQICYSISNNPVPNRPNNPNNSNNASYSNILNDPRKNFNSLYDGDADVIVVGQKDILRCENWTEMNFDKQLLKNIREEAGFIRPRKIQEVLLPYLADGNDIVCQSETGTGKTASYLIPIIDDLIKQKQANRLNAAGPYCIILAPTHEFIEQIFEEAQKFSKYTGITVARDYGGTNEKEMNELIAKGCNILCACLGRLLELMKEQKWSLLDRIKNSLSISKKQKPFSMSNVKYIVVDEADHFLEGKHQFLTFFSHKSLPKVNKIQNLFFSSTLQAPRLHELTKSYINLQKRVHITSILESNQRIRHIVVSIPSESDKFLCLTKMVSDIGTANGGVIPKIMIFVNSIVWADELTRYLTIAGYPAVVIHSELYPDERKKANNSFKNGKPFSKLLVSVNACGRGVHTGRGGQKSDPTDQPTGFAGRKKNGQRGEYVKNSKFLMKILAHS